MCVDLYLGFIICSIHLRVCFLQPVLYCFDDCSFASIISSKVRECDCSSSALLSQDCSYSHFMDIFSRTVTAPRSARQCTCVHSCRVKAGDRYCEKNLDEGGIGEGRLHQGRRGRGRFLQEEYVVDRSLWSSTSSFCMDPPGSAWWCWLLLCGLVGVHRQVSFAFCSATVGSDWARPVGVTVPVYLGRIGEDKEHRVGFTLRA